MLTRLRRWLFGETYNELLARQRQEAIQEINNRMMDSLIDSMIRLSVSTPKRKPGRPKGSKNKKRKIAV